MQSILTQLFQSTLFSALSLVCVLLFLYSTYATYRIFFRSARVDHEIKALGKTSAVWHLHDIRHCIKTAFQAMQTAISQDNSSLLKNVMTQHLYAHFELIMLNHDDHDIKEVIRRAKLHSVSIVSVEKNQDDSEDALWAYMDFSKIDFEIN